MVGRYLVACVSALAACSFNPSGMSGDDDVVDPDAGDDAATDGVDPDAPCVAACSDGQLRTCTAGVPDPPQTCAAGCAPDASPRCAVLVPSNGATTQDLDDATAAVVAVADRTLVFNSDTGAVISYLGTTPTMIRPAGPGVMNGISYRTRTQGGGAPEAAIFGMASLTVEPMNNGGAGSLRVIGDRATILLVDGAVMIGGEVDVGAGRMGPTLSVACQRCGGAGGGDGANALTAASGCAPGGNGTFYDLEDETGGAGGGFGSGGANGGDSLPAIGGNAPAIEPCGAALIPLRGGSGGGRGAYSAFSTNGGAHGGGGGGALQLTSMTSISLTAGADLYAGGAGGDGQGALYGGGGGGSGGGFLLEAPSISVTGNARITANGGGGGSGRVANRGENGGRGTARASGGAGDGTGGAGGLGGASTSPSAGSGNVDGTGGGGGGAGLIRVHTVATFTVPGTAIISPPAGTATAGVQ